MATKELVAKEKKVSTKKVKEVSNAEQIDNVKEVIEDVNNKPENTEPPRLTPEMITAPDMALRVLMSATNVAFENNLYKDMNDVACIDKSIKMTNSFINMEIFKVQNYNVTLLETVNPEGKNSVEKVELAFAPTKTEGINRAIVEHFEGKACFMFFNGQAVILNAGDEVFDVFGILVPKVNKK